MKALEPKQIRQVGQDRKVETLGESFILKWREFFGFDPDIAQIQQFVLESEQLCLSEEYFFDDEVSLVGPSIFWNKARGLMIMVDFFAGVVIGFLIRRELSELMGWSSSLRFQAGGGHSIGA
jgi:hypothetical protein